MYPGSVVEPSDSDEAFENPIHPYTKVHFSAIPLPDPKEEKTGHRIMLQGTLPGPIGMERSVSSVPDARSARRAVKALCFSSGK